MELARKDTFHLVVVPRCSEQNNNGSIISVPVQSETRSPQSILKNMRTGEQKDLYLDTTPKSIYLQKLKKQLENVTEKGKGDFADTAKENGSSPQSRIN